MKNGKILLIVILCGLFLTGCNGGNKENTTEENITSQSKDNAKEKSSRIYDNKGVLVEEFSSESK